MGFTPSCALNCRLASTVCRPAASFPRESTEGFLDNYPPPECNFSAPPVLGGANTIGNETLIPTCACPGDVPCGTFVVKLSNDANPPASGDLAEVEPGKVTTTLRATVYDNNNQPVPNINVKLEVTVEAYSGGHQHNDNRPKGLLSNGVSAGIVVEGNTGSGGMPFTFLARPPAGDHKIIATCIGRDCRQEGPDKVWVGFRGLVPFTQPGSYVLVGFTPSHPANSHNLKPTVSGLVRALTNVYRSRFPPRPGATSERCEP